MAIQFTAFRRITWYKYEYEFFKPVLMKDHNHGTDSGVAAGGIDCPTLSPRNYIFIIQGSMKEIKRDWCSYNWLC